MKYPLLSAIDGPADVKALDATQLDALAAEVREALIEKLAAHGGHIGPNLGFVEATIALHRVFDSPRDKIVFDVSHQCYAHKMLTGRARAFTDPAHYDDVSGFTAPEESEHDLFTVGHTSTSIGLASGLARGRDVLGGTENVIAVIGDGSLSGGEALEALDLAGEQGTNLIIVLNDNNMSIAENHGGLYQNLAELRATGGTCESNMFRAWGLDYLYVEEGNSVAALVKAFERVRGIDHPIVVHIHTLKGKGLPFAEQDPEPWHAGGPFDRTTGERPASTAPAAYSDVLGEHLWECMQRDPSIIAINASTPGFLGMRPARRAEAGRRFVDPGIAEENAAAMASGMAKAGARPVWGVGSTFSQRTYDQVAQEICINNSPVTMLVYGGSVNGMSSVTHVGHFDVSLFSNIPNLVYLAPTNTDELLAMFDWSVGQTEHPVAIRVPYGAATPAGRPVPASFGELNRFEVVRRGTGVAVIAAGDFFGLGAELADAIEEATGRPATLINPRFLTGVDEQLLHELEADHTQVVTLEDSILDGALGEKIARHYGPTAMRVRCYGLAKEFLDRYDVAEVMRERRLTVPQIMEDLAL